MKLQITINEATTSVTCSSCNSGLEINSGVRLVGGRDLLNISTETCGRWAANHICGVAQSRNDRTNAMTMFFKNIADSIQRWAYNT